MEVDMDVVLVEDSALIAAQLLGKLRQQPSLRVVGAAAGEDEAVDLILRELPDAVILDLGLAPGSGLDVLRRIRQVGNTAHVLVLTNSTHPEIRNACLQAGAGHFFDKHTQAEACIQALLALGSHGNAARGH